MGVGGDGLTHFLFHRSAQATVITSVNPTPTMAIGFGYVMAMFCLGLVNSLGTHYFFQSGIVAGIQARTAVAAMIYRKGLKLSVLARQDFTSGKIINLVSTDCQRIELFMMFYHVMWAAPIQILLILALMISQIGVSALAGVGLIFLLAPAQGVLFKRLGRIRGSVAPIADKRIRLIQELLSGIKVIKFFT